MANMSSSTATPTISLPFTAGSVQDLMDLSKQLNTDPAGVVGQALALLKIAQGRQIILQRDNEKRQIDKYANLPPKTP